MVRACDQHYGGQGFDSYLELWHPFCSSFACCQENVICSNNVLVFIYILPLNKTDLQTSSQRLNLSGTANMPVAKLDPDESFDQVIQHEVKELGTHM